MNHHWCWQKGGCEQLRCGAETHQIDSIEAARPVYVDGTGSEIQLNHALES